MAVPNLTPEQLQQILAIRGENWRPYAANADGSNFREWTTPDGFSVYFKPGVRQVATGDAEMFAPDPGADRTLIYQSTGRNTANVFDDRGQFIGVSSGDSTRTGLAKFALGSLAAYGAVAGAAGATGAGASAAGSGAAMTTAEQIAALQAAGMTQAEIAAMVPGAMAPGTMTAAGTGAAAAGGAGASAGGAGTMTAMQQAFPWISAASQLYGTFAQGQAAENASAAQQQAAQSGIDEQRRQFDLVQQLLAPYAQAGTKALGGQADLAGLNGTDAQRAAIAALEGSPQMAALVQQGETAILQNASATGGLRGGNTQSALATFRPNLLAQMIEQQYSRLGGLTSIGQNAAAGTGNAGLTTGNNVTQLLGQIGASQAGGALAQGATNTGYAAALAQLAGMYGGLGGATPGGTPPIAPATRGGF